MDKRDNYLINEKTVLLTGVYNDRGELWSSVIEGKDKILVRKAPTKVIEGPLLHVGSDFLGARHSSKFLMEPKRIQPISINPQMGILLFPTKNIKSPKCIWFSLMHVKSTKHVGLKKTEVLTSYGHTILIDLTESSFNNRLHKALLLRDTISKNLKCPIYFYVEPKKHFFISKKPTDINQPKNKK
jgi:competence protein ComK